MNDNRERRLILFTRYPEPGKVKTRLVPALGAEGAAALHRRLTLRALRVAEAACAGRNAAFEIRFDGGTEATMRHWLGDGKLFRPQGEGHLGVRMSRAFEQSFQEGSRATIIMGADCPALTSDHLTMAFENLSAHPAVFGPASDGGYYLVGLRQAIPELFDGPAWGTETVLADSLQILERQKLNPAVLDRLDDVDRPEDLALWRRIADAEEAGWSRISVIIPALNEAEQITATIANVKQCAPHEIIVVDGGSADETERWARETGATVLHSSAGRARQMNAGAAYATGNVLLFLHADTWLPLNYKQAVTKILHRRQVAAGAFRFRIRAIFHGKRVIESAVNLRSRWLQMPYGDQALFLPRSLFEEMGGFADLPVMEDYDFVRRLRRHGRIIIAKTETFTSGRRWLQVGAFQTILINRLVIAGYQVGVSPARLARLYRKNGHPHPQKEVAAAKTRNRAQD